MSDAGGCAKSDTTDSRAEIASVASDIGLSRFEETDCANGLVLKQWLLDGCGAAHTLSPMSLSPPNSASLLAATIRRGHPGFLDLPWGVSLDDWKPGCPRVEELPRGLSRHPVIFVSYDSGLYAMKELPDGLALREYNVLREMEERRLPAVQPVGHVRVRQRDAVVSVLITRYLDHAMPYHALFMRSSLLRYRDHLLDAMAALLVQLHLAGVFWGDCSLSNTLFRRDAGRLNAYFVDGETSEVRDALSDGMRGSDLDIMLENVYGGLLDLKAMGALPARFPVSEIGPYIRNQYEALWNQITREEIVRADEQYRIEERVRALNDLGFSVDQIEIVGAEAGDRLRLRAQVADRHFHRDTLHSLTGLDPEKMQARQMLNEIHERRAILSARENRSIPLSSAAHNWLHEVYMPTIERLQPALQAAPDPAEVYCQLLEHKWYLSERAGHDVGLRAAVEDFLGRNEAQPKDAAG